jgi:hypothetical protein
MHARARHRRIDELAAKRGRTAAETAELMQLLKLLSERAKDPTYAVESRV